MQAHFAAPEMPPASDLAKKPGRSTLVSRNVTISGHRTSVRLEPEMWSGLSEICRRERASLHEVCTSVAMRKTENTSLTAAIRVFVMAYFRAAATEEGHGKAGHGYGASLNSGGMAPSSVHAHPMAMQRPASSSPYMIGAAHIAAGHKNGVR